MSADYETRFEAAADAQGFEAPLQESPIDAPDGWTGGAVVQTGGFILCRIWRTFDYDEKENDVEFQVVYGENPGVSLERYEWNPEFGGYEWAANVENRGVDENTDDAKADVAQGLMADFDPEDHR